MNGRMIGHTVGYVMCADAGLLLIPMLIALYMGENFTAFLYPALAAAVLGGLLLLLRPASKAMYARDGFAIVSLSWVLVSLFGTVPFMISGAIPSFVDALFETISGFTTTGASVLKDLDILPRSILFWRSFSQWIGGMGVLVFIMAILPMRNDRSMHMMRAECPGPSVGKILPRARDAALCLYGIYLALTVLEVILLLVGGMPLFDSLLTSFSSLATGGFSFSNAGFAAYDSVYLEAVTTVFMLLAGINFTVYFFLIIGSFRPIFKLEEVWIYLGTVACSTLLIAVNTISQYGNSFGQALRYSSFQVVSVITSTGYATADFNAWPAFSKCILLLLMFMGACGGSTGGGIKVSRIVILIKKVWADMMRLLHPRAVRVIRMEGHRLDDTVVSGTSLFFIVYLFIAMASTLLLSLDGCNLETALSASVSALSNTGPGFGAVGPMYNYGFLADGSKLLLSFLMLLGRLEIFPLLLMLTPSMYRRR